MASAAGLPAKYLRIIAFTGLLSTISPAAAEEPLDLRLVLKRLGDYMTALAAPVFWQGSKIDETEIRLNRAGVYNRGDRLTFDTVYLRELFKSDGRFVIGQLRAPYATLPLEGGSQLVVSGVGLFGTRVPKEPQGRFPGVPLDFDEFAIEQMAVHSSGAQALSIDDVHITAETGTDTVHYRGAVEGITLDLMPLPDTWLRLFAMQMGYSKLRGYVEFEASVAGNPGVMSIDQLDFTVLNAAAVYATAELESVGPASNEQSAKLHRSDVSFPSEGLLLRAATLRIEDNSLTKRALALIVGWQDISPEMASLQAQAGFGLTFGPLLGPQGSVEAATTFKKFLDNPGALDISIATKKPIPLEALFDPSAYPRVAPDVEVSFTLDE